MKDTRLLILFILFCNTQVQPEILVRSLHFWKPYMGHLMLWLGNEACSRSKPLGKCYYSLLSPSICNIVLRHSSPFVMFVFLQRLVRCSLWTTTAPQESCSCHCQVCRRVSKQNESDLSRTRNFAWARHCGSEISHWTSFRTRYGWCASW